MTITESRPSEFIGIKLEFVRPFACTNVVEFTFKPVGEQTTVTWSMSGKNNFMAKAIGLCMNKDKTVGRQFEQGLASLRSGVRSRDPVGHSRNRAGPFVIGEIASSR
ncbi:MAG: hypothetical protein M3463_04990 [Verrucomicrobiota bacterium]|nr:hypothetical protein [Verrucomicrobiota bacterium]